MCGGNLLVGDAQMLLELFLCHMRGQAHAALQRFGIFVVNLMIVQFIFGVVRLQANITDKVCLDLEWEFKIIYSTLF